MIKRGRNRAGELLGSWRRMVVAVVLVSTAGFATLASGPMSGPGSASATSIAGPHLLAGPHLSNSATLSSCKTNELVIWLDTQGGGAAGSVYYDLELTNLSSVACTLEGYPGVSAVNLVGHQLGNAARRNTTANPSTITLSPGATAMAILQLTDAGNYPSSACHPGTAAGLRVYPPGQKASKIVPYPFLACNRSGENYLHVEAIERRP
jgi:hypothetical protein